MSSLHGATARLGHAGAVKQQTGHAACVRATRPKLRAVFALARVEGWLLARNTLVVAGLLVAAVLAWSLLTRGEPLWWKADWQIGCAQMVLSAVVVIATHLAAGRAKRNNMADLYGTFPVTAGMRTAAHLISVLGALPASVILLAAASVLTLWQGAFGSPDPAVLAGGVLLVIAGAMIGVAVGRRFPHPFVGILAALAWAAPFSQSNRLNGPVTWLFPWVISWQFGAFSHPLPGYPPGAAHAVELAGIAGLAAVAAFAWQARTAFARGALFAAGTVAVAVISIASVVELQPISTSNLNRLVAQAATPAQFQTCTDLNGVRYCFYPDFASLRSSLEGPVNAVLAYVPSRPNLTLSVEQSTSLFLPDATFTHGHSAAQIDTWTDELANAPVNRPSQSTIFIGVGSWPASSTSAASAAHLQLALATADWAVGLPPSTGNVDIAPPCAPVNQAREPIAIWITLEATHSKAKGVRAVAGGPAYLAAPGPQITDTGYLLAQAMTRLPAAKVTQILDQHWATWTNRDTTDAQLAAALGIALPTVSALNPTSQPGVNVSTPPSGIPTPPVCTP